MKASSKARSGKGKVQTRRDKIRASEEASSVGPERRKLVDRGSARKDHFTNINRCIIYDLNNTTHEFRFGEMSRFCANIYCREDGFQCNKPDDECERVYLDPKSFLRNVYAFKEHIKSEATQHLKLAKRMLKDGCRHCGATEYKHEYEEKLFHKLCVRDTLESIITNFKMYEATIKRKKGSRITIRAVFRNFIYPLLSAPEDELLLFYNRIHSSPIRDQVLIPLLRARVNNMNDRFHFPPPVTVKRRDIKFRMAWKHERCNNFSMCGGVKALRHCSDCYTVVYCSTACQKTDWDFHSAVCYKHKLILSRFNDMD